MNPQLNSIILYFKSKLDLGSCYTEEHILHIIKTDNFFGDRLSGEELEQVSREIISSFDIVQDKGATIRSNCKPWLASRKPDIDFYYWDRLNKYMLSEQILPPRVISTLDVVTDEVLDCCGNPAEEGPWAQRGMVIGHVQSGKTTNYSALITKAADAGYRIVILLAGLTNSLRSQTQQRLDEYFIGRKSVFQAAAQQPLEILKFCNVRRDPAYGTSREQDFNKSSATTAGVSLSALREPMIFIIKKNKSVLENLNQWIKDQHHGRKIDYPLLLIDDEADNASINTHKDPTRATTINALIREILSNFSRSTYIGYTATPFANIFIEPDSSQKMEEEDLFPRNFIKALDPPTNYSGAERIFTDRGDLKQDTVREVSDYADIIPLKHKKEIAQDLDCLPPSLYKAVRVFVLSRAVRYMRGQGKKHCSMMINITRFNDVQEKIHGLVYAYLLELKSAIAVSARAENGSEDKHIKDLEQTFLEEYDGLPESFSEVLKILHAAVSSIIVTTVNMRGGRLDYEKNKDNGLHVIAVGGLALSRGLTLEGLTVTYLLRNVSASDTLMQMARWFGYRPGYEDVCRIYLQRSALEHYEHTHESIEELCSEVKRMEQLGMTPYQFGLKVRQSPTGIRITAANKMRTATELPLSQDYSGEHIEAHSVFNNKDLNLEHMAIAREFFAGLGPASSELTQEFEYPYWNKVSGRKVVDLIGKFKFPESSIAFANISGTSSLILDYISDRISSELSEWDVAIAGPKKKSELPPLTDLVPGLSLLARRRASGTVERGVFRATGKKNKVADPGDASIGLTEDEIAEAEASGLKGEKKYGLIRARPLLLFHLFGVEDGVVDGFEMGPHCLSLSVCFPATEIPAVERKYHVNEIFRRSLLQPFDDEEDDDAELLMEAPTL